MTIKKLILQNVQKHSALELTFQGGINILFGHTDSGKSSIVRALRWVLFDDFNSNEIRKQGTKQTAVTVIFDSNIEVTRIKSNTINAYEIKNGEEVKRFDSIGKGIPEEVQKIFGMELFEIDGQKINLNIAEQLSAPFLLGKEYPSTFRAKLFNQLTGNDLQDKLFKELNKDILSFGKEITINKNSTEELTKELEDISIKQVKLNELYEESHNTLLYIEDLDSQRNTYLNIFQRLTKNNTELETYQTKVNGLKTVEIGYIKEKIECLKALKQAQISLNLNDNAQKDAESRLSQIKTPDLQFDEIYVILNRVDKLKVIYQKSRDLDNKINEVLSKQKEIDSKDVENKQKLEELKKNFTSCPLCDKIVSNEELEKLRK